MSKSRPPKEPTPARQAVPPLPKREGVGVKTPRSHSSTLTRFGGGGEPRRAGGGSYWERRIVAGLIALTLLLTSLPYLLGYYSTPPGTRFIGTAYNIDDYCNYLSWVRQTADGHFFFHNLFTTDPQKDVEFNVFFWLLGRAVHHLRVTPQAVLQAARVGGGLILLWLISRLYRYCLPGDGDRRARLTAFGFVCLSSGLGWLQWAHWHDKNRPGSPVDAWQPEAYTFLSLYTSPLFTVSLIFIVGALYALLKGEEKGRWRYAVKAGLCGAVLGNMHSYDVLHIAVVWGLFLVVWTVLKRGQGMAKSWLRGILALAITMPTTLYQFHMYQSVAVFRKRADVPTLAPAFWHYALGYGLVFALALLALVWLWRSRVSLVPPLSGAGGELGASGFDRRMVFAVCWAVGGFVAAYLPFAFQRKMLMGTHIPLCLLAGVGAAWLVHRLTPRLQTVALALLVLASFPSNGLFLLRDINHLTANRSETGLEPYLPDTVYQAYGWIRQNLRPRQDAVLSFPPLAAPLPGATDRVVWVGHWAETPEYGEKLLAFSHFADAATPDAKRVAFLRSIPATYLLYPNDVSQLDYTDKRGLVHHYADFAHQVPSYLKTTYTNKDFTVFHILL